MPVFNKGDLITLARQSTRTSNGVNLRYGRTYEVMQYKPGGSYDPATVRLKGIGGPNSHGYGSCPYAKSFQLATNVDTGLYSNVQDDGYDAY